MRNASSHPAARGVRRGGGGVGDGGGHTAAQPSESRPIIMKAVTAEAEATQDYSTAA